MTKRNRNIEDMLKKYNSFVHPVGETLPEPVGVYRVNVLTSFYHSILFTSADKSADIA